MATKDTVPPRPGNLYRVGFREEIPEELLALASESVSVRTPSPKQADVIADTLADAVQQIQTAFPTAVVNRAEFVRISVQTQTTHRNGRFINDNIITYRLND